MPSKAKPKVHISPPPDYTPEYVTDVSEAIYRARLGPKDVAQMIEADGDGGQKLRNRARAYDPLTRDYLKLLKPVGKP